MKYICLDANVAELGKYRAFMDEFPFGEYGILCADDAIDDFVSQGVQPSQLITDSEVYEAWRLMSFIPFDGHLRSHSGWLSGYGEGI